MAGAKGEEMSGLILCRTKEAKNPYYISNLDLHIYSLEELCYYIYNNIYLIGIDLVNVKLIEFIREDVEETTLADRLQFLLDRKAGLGEMVLTILKYVDYYTPAEIEKIRGILETLNTQNVYERLKARADSFMKNECFYSAIRNYSNIIDGPRDNTLPGLFYANVWHNMGVAFARLFLFEQAGKCFDTAYQLSQYEDSAKCSAAAAMLARNCENGGSYDVEFLDKQSEEEYVLCREVETLMDNAVYSEAYQKLTTTQKQLDQWKNEYGRYTS